MTKTARLDCPHVDVRLYVSTQIEQDFRVKACTKEPWTCQWIKSMPQGSVLYDVGANVGSYSLMAAALGHKVVAIEPSFANYARLCENILLNDLGHLITPVCMAVSRNVVPVLIAQHTEPGYSGGGKRLLVPADTLYGMQYEREFDEATHVKIDTDGSELDVLRHIMDGVASWMIEVSYAHEQEVLAFMKGAGYTRKPLPGGERMSGPPLTNCFYALFERD